MTRSWKGVGGEGRLEGVVSKELENTTRHLPHLCITWKDIPWRKVFVWERHSYWEYTMLCHHLSTTQNLQFSLLAKSGKTCCSSTNCWTLALPLLFSSLLRGIWAGTESSQHLPVGSEPTDHCQLMFFSRLVERSYCKLLCKNEQPRTMSIHPKVHPEVLCEYWPLSLHISFLFLRYSWANSLSWQTAISHSALKVVAFRWQSAYFFQMNWTIKII